MAEATKLVKSSAKRKPPRAGMGRPKGSKNKFSNDIKDAIIKAAHAAGEEHGKEGMISYLTTQAKEQPVAFMGLIGKALPMTVEGGDKPLTGEITLRIVRPNAD